MSATLTDLDALPANGGPSDKKISLVIFDKDGTLICFDSVWLWWVEEFTKGVSQSVAQMLERDLYKSLQYCNEKKKVTTDSPIAYCTNENLSQFLVDSLANYSISADLSRAIVESNWREHVVRKEPDLDKTVIPLFDVRKVFEKLRGIGIKVALCTSDSREPTVAQLKHLDVLDCVEYMICGDDENCVPKPAPDNVASICRHLGVPLHETAVVGDTVADVRMGRAAGAGLVVGVLSGCGNEDDLKPHCDVLLGNASQLVDFIEKRVPSESRR